MRFSGHRETVVPHRGKPKQRNVAEGDKFNSRWQRHRNGSKTHSDPERVASNMSSTLAGSEPFFLRSGGVATGY